MALSDLFLDYGIPIAPPGHKHYREDWINTSCPFCEGHDGYHLGFNTLQNYFVCWRCGGHQVLHTISRLLNLPNSKARELSNTYRVTKRDIFALSVDKDIKIGKNIFKTPSGVTELQTPHKRYLEKRGFDPEQLEKEWNIQGTGPVSILDDISYSYRIFIPISWNGRIVTFQTRDYTNKHTKKYLACPMDREAVHHKHLLYGKFNQRSDIGIIVEGAFDVWKLNTNTFSTLGIQYTKKQVSLISRMFKRIYVIFDAEKQAQEQAQKLADTLTMCGCDSYRYEGLDTDPADLSNDDVVHLFKQLKKL